MTGGLCERPRKARQRPASADPSEGFQDEKGPRAKALGSIGFWAFCDLGAEFGWLAGCRLLVLIELGA